MTPDLFTSSWESLIEQRAAEARAEIRAMVEHARRCIGQQSRRANEKIALARINAEGGYRIAMRRKP